MSKTALAAGFAPATEADWRALAEKTLKGAAPESLTVDIEGVGIAPLYTAANAPAYPPALNRRDHGHNRPFDLRAPIRARGAVETRRAILEALDGGAASVLIDLTQAEPAILPDMLEGVLTDVAPIALAAETRGVEAAEALSRAVKASPAAPLAFNLDPIGAGVAMDAGAWAETAARLYALHPRASLFLADGARAHEAGAEPVAELAFALACAIDYARALAGAGLSVEDAFRATVLSLAVDQKPLIGIAKLRAARRLWDRAAEACGVSSPATIEARSSFRMLTIADPWSNLVRLTIAAFAGAVGGADALVLYPHDAAASSTDPPGARLARNAGLALMEESALGRVIDPGAGAFALEALTDDLARAAWSAFQEIERAGGAAAAGGDWLTEKAAESRAALRQALADKRLRIVGVTDYPPPEASKLEASTPAGTLRLEALVP